MNLNLLENILNLLYSTTVAGAAKISLLRYTA